MVTNQPEWEYVDNLGDASPLEYGGAFLYRDKTGVYGYELERVELLDESDENTQYEIRRVCLDRCKVVDGVLVPYGYDAATYPHPLQRYEEWFAQDLQRIADFIGSTKDALIAELCSDDGRARALAYMAIGDYHGWDNLDSYPLTLTREECEKRYTDGELS